MCFPVGSGSSRKPRPDHPWCEHAHAYYSNVQIFDSVSERLLKPFEIVPLRSYSHEAVYLATLDDRTIAARKCDRISIEPRKAEEVSDEEDSEEGEKEEESECEDGDGDESSTSDVVSAGSSYSSQAHDSAAATCPPPKPTYLCYTSRLADMEHSVPSCSANSDYLNDSGLSAHHPRSNIREPCIPTSATLSAAAAASLDADVLHTSASSPYPEPLSSQCTGSLCDIVKDAAENRCLEQKPCMPGNLKHLHTWGQARHFRRLKGPAHDTLARYRLVYRCARCGYREHKEWFNLEPDVLQSVVDFWYAFLSTQPYGAPEELMVHDHAKLDYRLEGRLDPEVLQEMPGPTSAPQISIADLLAKWGALLQVPGYCDLDVAFDHADANPVFAVAGACAIATQISRTLPVDVDELPDDSGDTSEAEDFEDETSASSPATRDDYDTDSDEETNTPKSVVNHTEVKSLTSVDDPAGNNVMENNDQNTGRHQGPSKSQSIVAAGNARKEAGSIVGSSRPLTNPSAHDAPNDPRSRSSLRKRKRDHDDDSCQTHREAPAQKRRLLVAAHPDDDASSEAENDGLGRRTRKIAERQIANAAVATVVLEDLYAQLHEDAREIRDLLMRPFTMSTDTAQPARTSRGQLQQLLHRLDVLVTSLRAVHDPRGSVFTDTNFSRARLVFFVENLIAELTALPDLTHEQVHGKRNASESSSSDSTSGDRFSIGSSLIFDKHDELYE